MALAAAIALAATPAVAQESRFVVVDISPSANERLAAGVEREYQRLRPSARPIDDLAMKRLLATGENPAAAVARLTKEAERNLAAGDCAGAVTAARDAEIIALLSVPVDDERDLLKRLYAVLVRCQDALDKPAERAVAATHLRDLVSLAPENLPPALWEKYVALATRPPASTELQIDSEPANAQISVDFHGEGVTPRTLKVAPGMHYIEVQKDGYRKAFRQLTVGAEPQRTALRLVERTHDRIDQASAALALLRSSELAKRPRTTSRLAQLARADTLVVFLATGRRVKISFFDAEGGALSAEDIESDFDPETGRVAALASRATPGSQRGGGGTTGRTAAAILAPVGGNAKNQTPGASEPDDNEAIPEVASQNKLAIYKKAIKPPTPWWSWAIAGVVAASVGAIIYADQPRQKSTLAIDARWFPPTP